MDGEPASLDPPISPRRSVGWRHVLAIFQTLLYGTLMFWGLNVRHSFGAGHTVPSSQLLLLQEGPLSFDPSYIDAPIPRSFEVAFALNLPAVVPGVLISFPINALLAIQAHHAIDIVSAGCVGVFVPPLWYGVGWWIDDRTGRRPPRLWHAGTLAERLSRNFANYLSAFGSPRSARFNPRNCSPGNR